MLLSTLALVGGLIAITTAVAMLRRSNPDSAIRPSGRGTQTAAKSRADNGAASGSNMHAVSIQMGPFPCDAVRGLREQRFLSAEAPPLPRPGCDKSRCDCRYRHHSDRRTHEERRLPIPTLDGFESMHQHGERRDSGDRRADD
jgi:hypothetical protein